ncbi:MAG: hypothetical protein IJW30_04630 [Clostridia bacterium]|nr:hypothetical protein [Clostridia bacterium]
MKRRFKALFGVLFSLLFCFLCLGYAQLTDTLEVTGSTAVQAQTGVFISDVESVSGMTVNAYTSTVLNSKVTLGSTAASTLDVQVTVHNNSEYVYKYNGVKYVVGGGTYDNEGITVTVTDMASGEELGAHASRTFTVRFAYRNAAAVSNSVLNSLLNFEFVPADEYVEEVAVSDALGRFKEILNAPDDYQSLLDAMADSDTSGRADTTYIGNVVEGTSSDTTFLNDLFTDETGKNYLTLNINGTATNVTAMIKNEELTTGGGEITIYLTAEEISYRWYQSGTVTVYAAVFAQNESGLWEQVGELFAGEASANAYSGNPFSAKNSFNTDTWESTQSYYGVAASATIGQIVTAAYNN